jgi:2-polyprenyl-6-methoxyphenol hydroxylase-like FAD-dependent oxidoreductase
MPKALVIGGGIGGLAAAIALRQAGFDVEVFERGTETQDAGAGLSLWANAIGALDALGLSEVIASAGVPYSIGGLRSWRGDVLNTMSMEDLRRFFRVPVLVVHRAELWDALADRGGRGNLRLGCRCVAVRQEGEHVVAEFDGQFPVQGDVLVGADGLKSIVRATLHGAAPPRYAGCTAWRSVVRFDAEIRATETWGEGSVFGQVPMSGGRAYWYATQNVPEGQPRGPDEKGRLLARFRGWHAPVEALIDAADESAILCNDIYDRDPLSTWGRGRITLLGDAAHPMTPFLGQGACQALEDAVVLGRCLRESTDVPSALRAYEAARIPRANLFVRRSRLVGRIAQVEKPIAVRVRNALLRFSNPHSQARHIARMIAFRP